MSDELDYVGRKPCGCYVVWLSHKLPAKVLAKDIAWCVRSGLSVERMSTEDARRKVNACTHEKAKDKQRSLL